jgi:hypothetical protein
MCAKNFPPSVLMPGLRFLQAKTIDNSSQLITATGVKYWKKSCERKPLKNTAIFSSCGMILVFQKYISVKNGLLDIV